MTDAQLTALFNVIRNETATGGNTKGRVANALQALADSMPWKGVWNWSANANAWPVSVKAGDIRVTTDELADPFLPAGTLLIAAIDGADSDVDYIKKT